MDGCGGNDKVDVGVDGSGGSNSVDSLVVRVIVVVLVIIVLIASGEGDSNDTDIVISEGDDGMNICSNYFTLVQYSSVLLLTYLSYFIILLYFNTSLMSLPPLF